MITLLKLHVEGFCSISELELPLNQGCTILIKGPNGFGKSSIFSAIVWGLYGKNLKGKPDVTTWKEKQSKDYHGVKVEVFFQKDGVVYKIIRCQNYQLTLDDGAKGKDRLLLYKDTDIVNVKSKPQIQDEIVKAIGMSYNLFINSIMFGQGLKRLIQETNADKKKIFEEIFDLEFINEAKSSAINLRSNILQEYRDVENQLSSYDRELKSLEDTYNDIKEQEDNEENELLSTKKKLQAKKKEYGDSLTEFTFKPDHLKAAKNKLDALKIEHKESMSVFKTDIEGLINDLYKDLQNKNLNAALIKVSKLKVNFEKSHKLEKQVIKAQEKVDDLNIKNKEYMEVYNKLQDVLDDLITVKEELDKLKASKGNNLSHKYKQKIKDIKESLSKLDDTRKSLKIQLDNYNWVIDDPLGNQGIKAYLFDSSLNLINEALDRYSEILGFRIEFTIDLDSTRKEFSTLIERDSHIIEYEELSGGEKQLINVAMAMAMNEALTSSKGINIAFLDEIFESLSYDNIELTLSLISKVFENKTLFLISHHENLPLSKYKTIQVEKVKGLSHYKVL